jgi:type III restriction enzyme
LVDLSRPFIVKDQDFITPKKSIFNRIVGDSHFELEFATFLDSCPDVISFVKNYFSINFKLDYVNHEGNIANYIPDFIVKLSDQRIFIIETKGLEDLDVSLKMERLAN